MEASELRIGNYVQSFLHNFDLKVEGIVGNKIYYGYKYSLDFRPNYEIEPIPLTEEWLAGFGFVHEAYSTLDPSEKSYSINLSFDLEDVIIIKSGKSFFFGHDGIDGAYAIYQELKYVHQLQNLYFALTGEELTIL
ncbi:hypothetical protein SAMN06265348_12419 [Pedobacter westerhofensis]|uniref:Uncharacterized protein n=1 Tax=Pedobacter westerhofensis TaxID=425512 RepID=A0A521FU06_9SPHI|nr:hypothetical protein [Pedobacter westerhofensis]SMO99626.1 hypothetical protein SAMN06265348_12419 [Pedobacter westerhofensis]